MQERRLNEIKATVFFALGILLLASLISFTPDDLSFYTSHPNIPPHNIIRGFGAYLAGALLFLIGYSAWLLPAFVIFWSIRLFKQEDLDFRFVRVFGFTVFILAISSLLAMLGNNASGVMQLSQGGLLGYLLSKPIVAGAGLGAYVIFLTLAILSLTLVFDVLVSTFFTTIIGNLKVLITKILSSQKKTILTLKQKTASIKPKLDSSIKRITPKIEDKLTPDAVEMKPRIQIAKPPKFASAAKSESPRKPLVASSAQGAKQYQLPPLDLLNSPPQVGPGRIKEDLTGYARILEDTLADFGIGVKVTDIERGPVITRYELEPAPGVKLNRIVSLGDDIALAMKARSVRIVAPIPGKGKVGVEIPNVESSAVYLRDVLSTTEFQKAESPLTLMLGKDITGKAVAADLGKMPHLLIAGATGSGKTVCVNSLILSILFRATPDEVKFIMIDPKMVELACFNKLPHLVCPVVTEAKKASVALAWAVGEMESRYRLFAKEGKRNIEGYNQSAEEKIPYIVIIVDELADLMVVAQEQVEGAIARLAQLSRAVGLHLILATQRPSVDVLTGVIKANFPARVSFKVASKVDSRTVLDANGADKLLGHGDMLFLKPGEPKLIRAQGSLVSDKEIEDVVEFISLQQEPYYDEGILKEQQNSALMIGEKDDIYDDAVRLVMETGQASVSILQRRMRLGYTRAARIIDSMEQDGLVGPFEGSKPRRIIVDREEWLKEQTMSSPEESQGE